MNKLKCLQCNKPIPKNKRYNKFCNRSCAASFNNKGVVRNGKKHIDRYCLNCNTLIDDKYWSNKKFCNSKCCSNYIHKKYIEDWKAGLKDGIVGSCQTSTHIKRYLNETQENKCLICGLDKWNNKPLPLILDHIDGHSENNREDNLRLVCSNCDSQLPTYKAKNIGNGRYSRRERYKQGKSH